MLQWQYIFSVNSLQFIQSLWLLLLQLLFVLYSTLVVVIMCQYTPNLSDDKKNLELDGVQYLISTMVCSLPPSPTWDHSPWPECSKYVSSAVGLSARSLQSVRPLCSTTSAPKSNRRFLYASWNMIMWCLHICLFSSWRNFLEGFIRASTCMMCNSLWCSCSSDLVMIFTYIEYALALQACHLIYPCLLVLVCSVQTR